MSHRDTKPGKRATKPGRRDIKPSKLPPAENAADALMAIFGYRRVGRFTRSGRFTRG